MCFFVITKNLKWRIFNEEFNFKRCDEDKDEKCQYHGVSEKRDSCFQRGVQKNPIYREVLPKNRGYEQVAGLKRGLVKKKGLCF